MANDLTELNNVLFTTLKKVESGELDDKKAQTIVNIGNAIVNNAKIQLSAFKLTGGKTNISLVGANKNSALRLANGRNNRSDFAYDFAFHKGYKNVAEAVSVMGSHKFNKELDEYIEDAQLG